MALSVSPRFTTCVLSVPGMTSTCPGRIRSGLEMSLAAIRSESEMSCSLAISVRVSPCCTV